MPTIDTTSVDTLDERLTYCKRRVPEYIHLDLGDPISVLVETEHYYVTISAERALGDAGDTLRYLVGYGKQSVATEHSMVYVNLLSPKSNTEIARKYQLLNGLAKAASIMAGVPQFAEDANQVRAFLKTIKVSDDASI